MTWLIAIAIIIALGWFVLNFENGCAVVIGAIVLVIVAVVLLITFITISDKNDKAKRRDISEAIESDILLIDSNMLQTDRYDSYNFTSKIKNNSKYNVTRIKFVFSIKDCVPSNNLDEQAVCNVIGENEADQYIDIPAGQIRSVFTRVDFSNMPPIEGDYIVEYGVNFVDVAL